MTSMLKFSNEESWKVSMPPDAADVIYNDLLVPPRHSMFLTAIGYIAILWLLIAYAPLVNLLCKYARVENLEKAWPDIDGTVKSLTWHGLPLASTVYNGLFHSLSLGLCMSFVPTFLSWIFNLFWVMKSGAEIQSSIQTWYFVFQIVCVLIITTIGDQLMHFGDEIVKRPLTFFSTCELNIADASHMYMKYLELQLCTMAFFDLSRLFVMVKYFWYARKKPATVAGLLAEPEDQDYYGIGSRSTRMAMIYIIALCFCQISPLINLLAIVFFAVCQLMYPYLIVFSETRKVDSGGTYWVNMLNQVQLGAFIYVVFMTGFLAAKANSKVPALIAGASIICLSVSFYRFHWLLLWEKLPMQDVGAVDPPEEMYVRASTRVSYQQPELVDTMPKTFDSPRSSGPRSGCLPSFSSAGKNVGFASDMSPRPTRGSADTLLGTQGLNFSRVPQGYASPNDSLPPANFSSPARMR